MAKTILIEASPWSTVDGTVVPVRLAGGGSRGYTHRGRSDWVAGVTDVPRFTSLIAFGQDGFTGGAIPQVASLSFAPSDPASITAIAALAWAGAAITILTGEDAVAAPAWTVELSGTVAGLTIQGNVMSFTVSDLSGALATPVASDRFLGTGGVEGGTDAKDRVKRRSWGRCWNVEGRLLDKVNNIYEFGDPAQKLQSFDVIKDKGRAATSVVTVAWAGSAAATLAALVAASPPAGGAAAAPSIACVKWWTQPITLTADLRGEIGAGYVETAAEIAQRVVSARTTLAIANVATVAASRPGPAGLHIGDDRETGAGALDRLLLGVSTAWVLDPDGTIRLQPFSFAAPVETLAAYEIARESVYKPVTERLLGYQRNHRIHSDAEISAVFAASDGTYADGTPIEDLKPAQPGADVTGGNTAAAITGQGPLATAPGGVNLDNGTYFGMPTRLQPSPGGLTSLPAGAILYGGPAYVTVDSLRPAEAGSNVTESRTAAAVTGQGPWATTSTPIAAVLTPSNNIIGNSTFRFGLSAWAASPANAWSTSKSGAGWAGVATALAAGTHTLLSDPFEFNGDVPYKLSLEDLSYYNAPTYRLLAYDPGGNRVPGDDFAITGLGGSNAFARTSSSLVNSTGSRRYRLLITWVANAPGQYFVIRKIKFEQNSVVTVWDDMASNGAVYSDLSSIDSLKPAEAGSNVTESRTALGITGQGSLATRNDVLAGTHLKDSGGVVLTDGAIKNAAITISAAGLLSGAGGGSVTFGGLGGGAVGLQTEVYFGQATLRESSGGSVASLANFKTSVGTASAIAGQGSLATRNDVLAGTHLKDSGGTVLTDGAIKNAAITISAAGLLSGAGGGSVTFGGLGGGAVGLQSEVYFGQATLKESSGGTVASLANFKTSVGTASAISGQGPWATTSTPIATVLTPGTNFVYNSTFRMGGQGWTAAYSGGTGFVQFQQGYTGYNCYMGPANAAGSVVTLTSDRFTTQGSVNHVIAIEDYVWATTRTVSLKFYDSTDTYISGGDVTISASSQFVRIKANAAAPSNAVYGRVVITLTNPATPAGGYCTIQKIKVEQGTIASPWTDDATNSAVYRDQTTIDALKPQEANSNRTETRTASAIAGQGSLATRSDVLAGTHLKDSGGAVLTDGAIKNAAISISAAGLLSGAGGGSVTFGGLGGGAVGLQTEVYFGQATLKESSGGAVASLANFKTSVGTASAITGQGTLATRSDVLAGTHLKDSGGTVLTDAAIKNAAITISAAGALSGAGGGSVTFGGLGGGAVGLQSEVFFGQATLKETSGGAVATLGAFKTASGTASAIAGQGAGATANSLTQLNATEGAKLTGIQSGADVTANSQHTLTSGASTVTFTADYTNTLLSGQISQTVALQRKVGSTNVTTTTAWAVVASAGITAAVSSAGVVSFTAAATGAVTVTGTYGGVALATVIQTTRVQNPPPSGGSGATSASTSSISNTSSTSYSSAGSDQLTVVCGSSGQIDLYASVDFALSGSGYCGCYGKWQWRIVGGSYADVAVETASGGDAYQPPGEPQIDDFPTVGHIDSNVSKSGLTNGTNYNFKWLWRANNTGSLSASGTCTAIQH